MKEIAIVSNGCHFEKGLDCSGVSVTSATTDVINHCKEFRLVHLFFYKISFP